MPIPLLSKYKDNDEKPIINKTIIERENEIETSLIPSIPSRKVFTTYNIGLAIETERQKSGSMFIE